MDDTSTATGNRKKKFVHFIWIYHVYFPFVSIGQMNKWMGKVKTITNNIHIPSYTHVRCACTITTMAAGIKITNTDSDSDSDNNKRKTAATASWDHKKLFRNVSLHCVLAHENPVVVSDFPNRKFHENMKRNKKENWTERNRNLKGAYKWFQRVMNCSLINHQQ